ncbi:MAG: 2-oxoglutarate dehydrogenase complex dihydrolipoyllysine-residue succinyltransferase [Parachlamydiaceae bacterium]
MKSEIKVPQMGESISEAIIGQILVEAGSFVKADTELLELETDKVNQVLYAPQAGVVTLTVKAGEIVKIGQMIGSIDSIVEKDTDGIPSVSNQNMMPASEGITSKSEKKAPQEEQKRTEPLQDWTIRLTTEHFIADLQCQKQEEDGSLIKENVVDFEGDRPEKKKETRRPLSKIRKVISERMLEAQQTMAILTTFNEVDLTEVMQLRQKYKEAFMKRYGQKLGLMSFFVKGVVSALQAFPNLNSYLDGDEIVHRQYYDVGVAVGTEKGVIVPILRKCDHLSFAEIEKEIENYAKKAKEGKLIVEDLQGGGFTITNGGIYGSLLSTPILIPPQCGILGMHKIQKRPVVVDDQITIRSMMYLALSYDHRLIDGKEAVSFLVHIKNMIEEPSRLLLDI